MKRNRLCNDKITIYNYLGEVDDVANYNKLVIPNCFVEKKYSNSSNATGNKNDSYVSILIFDNERYESPNSYYSCCCKDKFTLINNGKDYVQLSNGEKFKISNYNIHNKGSKRMHHIEVIAR